MHRGELGRVELNVQRRVRREERHVLARDEPLDRAVLLEAREELVERIRVNAPAEHCLVAGGVPAFDEERLDAGLREPVRGGAPGRTRARDHGVELLHEFGRR